MGKRIYVPSKAELYQMQEYNANVYKYLVIKAIETIVMDGTILTHKGILKNEPKVIRENPDIARGVCYLCPGEIVYSEVAQIDLRLCQSLIYQELVNTSLDNIGLFSNSILTSPIIISDTIKKLIEILRANPQYRFAYKEPNELLDNIFSCCIDKYQVISPDVINMLCEIEPAYALKFLEPSSTLRKSIVAYGKRYALDISLGEEFYGKDILTNPSQDVKRLIRIINSNTKR